MDATVIKPKWPRRLLTALAVFALLCLAVLISTRAALRSDWGRKLVVSKIEAAKPAGQSISVTGLEGDLFKNLSIRHLEISDKNGVWLSVDDLKVKWSPAKLLGRSLEVNGLSALHVDVLARPEFAPSSGEGSSPVRSILTENVRFPSLTIGGSILPNPQTLSLTASASHGGKGGELNFNGATLGTAPLDTIDADIEWSPELLITGDAKVQSLPGGVVTSLLRLQAGQPLNLDMASTGTRQASETNILGRLGEKNFAQAQLRIDDDQQYITGSFDPESIPALQSYADLFGGEAIIDAVVDRSEKRLKAKGALRSENLNFSGNVQQTKDGYALPQLNLTSRAPMALFPSSPASVGEVVFNGSADMADTQTVKGELEIKDIRYGDYYAAALSGPAALTLNSGQAAFDLNLTGVVPQGSAARRWSGKAPRVEVAGVYDLDKKTAALSKSNIRLAGLDMQAKGSVDAGRKNTQLGGTFLLAKGGLGLTLPAVLNGRFSAKSLKQGMAINVSGKAEEFSDLPAPLGQLLGESASYKALVNIGQTNDISMTQASLTSDGLSVEGAGIYKSGGTLSADLTYAVDAFEIAGLKAAPTTGQALLSGRSDALDFDVKGQMPALDIRGRTVSDLDYVLTGVRTGAAITAKINATGKDEAGTAALQSNARFENGNWTLTEINSDLFGVSVTGDMSGKGGDLAALQTSLKISGDPSQLAPAGDVDLTVNLANKSAVIDGKISEINAGTLTDAVLTIDVRGPREAAAFTIGLTGDSVLNDITRPLEITLAGRADLAAQYMTLSAVLDGTLGRMTFKSNGPLTLRQSPSAFGFAGDGRLSVFGGDVSYALSDAGEQLTLGGKNLALSSILALAGRPGVDGTAAFDAALVPENGVVNAAFSALLANIKQPGSKAEALDLNIDAVLNNRDFTLTAVSRNEALTGQAELRGALDTSLSAPFILWPPQSALIGTVDASGDIGSLTELVLPPETDVEGIVQMDMGFSVPLEASGVTGTMNMQGGVFEQGTAGIHLTDIAFKSVFEDLSVVVTDFSANGKKGGTLTGGGKMGLRSTDQGAISLTATKLYILDRREGEATVSGQLNFTRSEERLKLAGTLNVDDAQVNLDKFPRAGRPTLDVNFSSDTEDEAEAVRYKTELAVAVTSASRIALRGSGVNASLALKANVTGPFEAPILKGDATVVRGRFDFLGKRFELKDSRVVFQPDIKDSRLEVKAVRETTDLTATIEVTGTMDRPEIKLSSDPTLPEDEVLSYILFGRSASQLTTLETARLAAALAQLSGGGGFDLLGGLENALGLDTLDVARSDTGQTQLTTGKYLSEDVYVEVRSSAEGSPGLAVEWTPRKNISVEAETSPGETQSVSIKWQKDFD